jgi:uncharacterized protein YprB with RNaseH-like and TPR domain
MIRNTFSILHGIGEKLEKRLWRNGIVTWNDFIGSSEIHFITPVKKHAFDDYLTLALSELFDGNAAYFTKALRRKEHWRLFDIFREKTACLDIETNGLMPENGGYITLIGLYDGFDYKCFVRDENLTLENIKKEFSHYKYLITFYGSVFDIPFMERSMPNLTLNVPHFDLCFGARKLGIRRGLKSLEEELGIERDETVRGMNGYDAVRLWEFSKRGSSEALNLLIAYNRADTVNLFRIADIVYQRLRSQTGIEEYL